MFTVVCTRPYRQSSSVVVLDTDIRRCSREFVRGKDYRKGSPVIRQRHTMRLVS
jgi:hypothetical protein